VGEEEGRGTVLEVLYAKKVKKGVGVRSKHLSADMQSPDLSVNRPSHMPTEIVGDIDKMRRNSEFLGCFDPLFEYF
jgi:hypothetical protein